jgi:hypothetical protein
MYRLHRFGDVFLPRATRSNFSFVGSSAVYAPTSRTANGQHIDLLGGRRAERTRQIIRWETIVSQATLDELYYGQEPYDLYEWLVRLRGMLGTVNELYRVRKQNQYANTQWTRARFVSMPLSPIGKNSQLINFEFEVLDPYWWSNGYRDAWYLVGASGSTIPPASFSAYNGNVPTPKIEIHFQQSNPITPLFEVAMGGAAGSVSWKIAPSGGNLFVDPYVDVLQHRVTDVNNTRSLYGDFSYGSSLTTDAHTAQYLLTIPTPDSGAENTIILRRSISGWIVLRHWEAYI